MTSHAATHPGHPDPTLRGRRYAIPFDQVWNSALTLAAERLRGWTVMEADDDDGIIRVTSRTLVFRFVDDVEIRVTLDADAQTRVDLSSRSRRGRWDLGANARRIRKFLRRLDRALEADAHTLLDPSEGVPVG